MNVKLRQESPINNSEHGAPKWWGSQGPGRVGAPPAAHPLPFPVEQFCASTELFPERTPCTNASGGCLLCRAPIQSDLMFKTASAWGASCYRPCNSAVMRLDRWCSGVHGDRWGCPETEAESDYRTRSGPQQFKPRKCVGLSPPGKPLKDAWTAVHSGLLSRPLCPGTRWKDKLASGVPWDQTRLSTDMVWDATWRVDKYHSPENTIHRLPNPNILTNSRRTEGK